jgi:nitrogen regulatory protein PII
LTNNINILYYKVDIVNDDNYLSAEALREKEQAVRKIEAIVHADTLDALHKAFLEAGIQKMTVTEVRDYGNSKTHTEIYRSEAFTVNSRAKVKIETIVPQNKVPTALSILKSKGQTGKGGDDRIFISSVNDVSRTSSNERWESV